MPNRRYQKGANLERRLKRELEARGLYVMRSAGSKGPWDLVAIDPWGMGIDQVVVTLYQVKARPPTAKEITVFQEAAQRVIGHGIMCHLTWPIGRGWERRTS